MANILYQGAFNVEQFIESIKRELSLYTEDKSKYYNFDFVNDRPDKPIHFEWEDSAVGTPK